MEIINVLASHVILKPVDKLRCQIKVILEKTIARNRKDWLDKLDDALWAYRMAFKTFICTTPYRLVYRKSCHLLIEIEHRTHWDIKRIDFDLASALEQRWLDLHGLEKYDKLIEKMEFNVGDKVLLYNSRMRLFPKKLMSCLSGPFTVQEDNSNGVVEITPSNSPRSFKVNGRSSINRIPQDPSNS
ncbi:uncharacterized protein LOC110739033 [Chenopodium quinoa]|uniref:uncharacterized protein LOC110739033 n=1 Tax=Chenopodium quinoa TaxID=63459 RepID=UPI000B776AAD|nr:uncharacterized protein LOC110739033 [Chenopodium quinoa]